MQEKIIVLVLSDSRERRILVRDVNHYFRTRGWIISKSPDHRADFAMKKQSMEFFVGCIDTKIQVYLDANTIFNRLCDDYQHFRRRTSGTYVVIFNFQFPGVSFESLADRNLLALTQEELELVTELESLDESLPRNLSRRQMLLLQGNEKICLAISDRYRQAGEFDNAIKWASWTIQGTNRATAARHKLYKLCLLAGEVDQAKIAIREALKFEPYSVVLLKALLKILQEENDISEICEVERKIIISSQRVRTFEDLITNQVNQSTSTIKTEPADQSARGAMGSLIKRLFAIRR